MHHSEHVRLDETVAQANTAIETMVPPPPVALGAGGTGVVDHEMNVWDLLLQKIKWFTKYADAISEVQQTTADRPLHLTCPHRFRIRFIRMLRWHGPSYPLHIRYAFSAHRWFDCSRLLTFGAGTSRLYLLRGTLTTASVIWLSL